MNIKTHKGSLDRITIDGELYVKLNRTNEDLVNTFDFEAHDDEWSHLSCSDIHEAMYGFPPKSRANETRFALGVLSRSGLTRGRSGYFMPPVKKEEINLRDVDL